MKLLKDELVKAMEVLAGLSPCSHEYGVCLQNIEILVREGDMFDDVERLIGGIEDETVVSALGTITVDADSGDVTYTPVDFVGAKGDIPEGAKVDDAKVEDAKVEDTKVDEGSGADMGKTYEPSEVRAALVDARRKGANISAILQEFGVENFSAFPAGRYAELMDRLARG